MTRKPKIDWEHNEQKALFSWVFAAQQTRPELALMFAIPNGGARHVAVAAKLKAEGVKAGVPDVFLPVARGNWHGLWVELKFQGNGVAKKGAVSDKQRQWLTALQAQGYQTAVCYGWHSAKETIENYLGGE